MVAAVSRGDSRALIEAVHPDAEVHALRSVVEGPYRGPDGARRFMRDNAESFELFEMRYREVEELPGDRVLAIGSIRIRGKGSGVETDVPTALIAEFRDGLLVWLRDYGDEASARAAAAQRRE